MQRAVRDDGTQRGRHRCSDIWLPRTQAPQPLGSFGAVVGATLGGTLRALDVSLDVNGPLLAPGIGAQGATAADLPTVFGAAVRNVVPSISRGVLRHGPSTGALRAAAEAEVALLAEAVGQHRA